MFCISFFICNIAGYNKSKENESNIIPMKKANHQDCIHQNAAVNLMARIPLPDPIAFIVFGGGYYIGKQLFRNRQSAICGEILQVCGTSGPPVCHISFMHSA